MPAHTAAEVAAARGTGHAVVPPSGKTVVSRPLRPKQGPADTKPANDVSDVHGQLAAQESTADSASTTNAGRAEASVAFQLLIVSAGPWLWLEQLDDALIRREQLQLVQGMARAITEGDLALTHLQFDWPLASHAHLPRHAEAARESVAGQLRRLAREQQVRGFILMGSACRQWVSAPPALSSLQIPSTLAMLADPALKREAWRVLQPHSP